MPPTLCVGAIVRAVGLNGRADLNGQRGTIVAFNDEKKRFAVEFDFGESVLMRPENLAVAMDCDATSASAFLAVSKRREAQREAEASTNAKTRTAGPPAGFRMWDIITITGLASKPELNGKTATITGWKGDKGRFSVSLPEGTELAIKPSTCVPTTRPKIDGEEKLTAFAVAEGDSNYGECLLCNDAHLSLVSPYLQCCGQSMCNDCGVKYQGRASGCPFCRAPFPTSVDEVLPLLKRQCARGDPRAMYQMSACLNVSKQDVCGAAPYAVALVDHGYAEAKLLMGNSCWQQGFLDLGTELMHSAADDGLAEAMLKIAGAFEYGTNGFSRSLEAAAKWYQRAAAKGDPRACSSLGVFFFHGHGGLEQSFAEAVNWYRKAAQLGDTRAMGFLAECLQAGRGCERDPEACGKWLHVAATLGNAMAQEMLEKDHFDWRRPPPIDFLVRQDFHQMMSKRLGIPHGEPKTVESALAEACIPEVDQHVLDALGDRIAGAPSPTP